MSKKRSFALLTMMLNDALICIIRLIHKGDSYNDCSVTRWTRTYPPTPPLLLPQWGQTPRLLFCALPLGDRCRECVSCLNRHSNSHANGASPLSEPWKFTVSVKPSPAALQGISAARVRTAGWREVPRERGVLPSRRHAERRRKQMRPTRMSSV